MIMMGSPPQVVNIVLVFVACAALAITVPKAGYLEEVKVSRATLDKYVKLLRERSIC